ncbi:MAG: hypothetical protein LQ339_007585 [Xanthoria mediterranea]|nr:MAG: hypothetical protein LQ339_007585 [Xanthoria mediterranea]
MALNQSKAFSLRDIPSLDGRVAIITGGSDGIGYATTLQLALHGARVYIIARSSEKATQAIANMRQSAAEKSLDIQFLQADLQSLASVIQVAKRFNEKESNLDILINNAGIMAAPYELTEDGYETQWQTNYLSPFLLTKSLLPTMTSTARKNAPARIINVVSDAAFVPITPDLDLENPNLDHLTGFMAPWKRYCHSKMAMVLLTHHLHTLFARDAMNIKTYSVHPGFVETNLQALDPTLLGKIVKFSVRWGLVPGKVSREDGARTTLACATSDDGQILEGSGGFFRPFGQRDKQGDALVEKVRERKLEEKLWDASEKMLKDKGL